MTKHLVVAVTLCLVWPVLAQTESLLEEQELPALVWQEGLMGAREKAKEVPAPIVLYFCDNFGVELVEKSKAPVASNLNWRCTALDKAFDDPRMKAVLTPCVRVKIPLDHSGQYEKVAAQYGVFGDRDLKDRTNLRRYYQQFFAQAPDIGGAGAEESAVRFNFRHLIHLHTFERTSLVFVSADDEMLGRVVPQWQAGQRSISTKALVAYVARIVSPYQKFAEARQARDALEMDRALALFKEVSESLAAPVSLNKLAEKELAGFQNLTPRLIQQAEALLKEGKLGKASKLLATLKSRSDLLSLTENEEVQAALNRVSTLAEAKLREAHQKAAAGDIETAKQIIQQLVQQLPGTEIAKKAQESIAALGKPGEAPGEIVTLEAGPGAETPKFILKPTVEPDVKKVLDEAEVLLLNAKQTESQGKMVEAYKLYTELVKNFPEHEAGKAARKWLTDLQKTPNLYRQILDQLAKADCTVWLSLAKSYYDNKMYDRALSYYQKIVDKYPGTTFAERAKKQVALIKKLKS